MAWPTGTVQTTNTDESTDDPSAARSDILAAMQKINLMVPARGVADGVASLDAGGKIPVGELANALVAANNLSELTNIATARTNLGAGATGATVFTGATAAAIRTTLSAQQTGLCVLKAGDSMSGQLTLSAGDPTADGHAARKAYVDTKTAGIVGEIKMYGASAAPTGYLLCNGAEVSRTTYSALFAVIGTAYGVGNGSTTFNVPDMRSRMPLGEGTGSGLTARALGDEVGAESFSIAITNMPAHNHPGSTFLRHGTNYATANLGIDFVSTYNENVTHSVSVASQGSGTTKTFQGPGLCVNFIIKT